ncbi:MAG: branched-chain amino acid transaminase [Thermomicrobiales bacterium]
MDNPKYLWWNGELVEWDRANVHVTAIGWSAVGAVFEGIRAYWNPDTEELHVFRLQEHMRRLGQSMKMMRLEPAWSIEHLTDQIIELLKANEVREDTYIRPLVYRGEGGGKGFSSHGGSTDILINTRPNPSHLLSGNHHSACVSSWTRISDNVMPPRIKNVANYRNGQLAGMEASMNGYDIALIMNQQGKIAEGGGSCVMIVRDGKLITPDVTQSILESITRDAIMQLARDEMGLEVVERAVDRTECYIADEIFMCGTAFEITPISSVNKYTVGNGEIGPITHRLEELLNDSFRGISGIRPEWRTAVGVESLVAAD